MLEVAEQEFDVDDTELGRVYCRWNRISPGRIRTLVHHVSV